MQLGGRGVRHEDTIRIDGVELPLLLCGEHAARLLALDAASPTHDSDTNVFPHRRHLTYALL